jgi:hypothetical protein
MRLNTLAVSTLMCLPSSLAFSPSANGPVGVRKAISMNMAKNSNDFTAALDQTKNGMLSVFAASMIFLAPGPAMIEPANAAAPSATAQTVKAAPAPAATTKAAPAKAEKPKVVDPLASEKAAVEAAKEKLAATASADTKAKKVLADASSAYKKTEDAALSAEKKVVERKKALISANDKLADAKAKEGAGSASALKEVENLASKVGMYT